MNEIPGDNLKVDNRNDLAEIKEYIAKIKGNLALFKEKVRRKGAFVEERIRKEITGLLTMEKYFNNNNEEEKFKITNAFKLQIQQDIIKNIGELIEIFDLIAKTEEVNENEKEAIKYYNKIHNLKTDYETRLVKFLKENKDFDRKIFREEKVRGIFLLAEEKLESKK